MRGENQGVAIKWKFPLLESSKYIYSTPGELGSCLCLKVR